MADSEKDISNKISILESVRCAISFLFELELNENPSNANNLYTLHYKKFFKDITPEILPIDSFRSIDPFYIHNYVLSKILCDKFILKLQSLFGDNPKDWYTWIINNIIKQYPNCNLFE